jgi:hypothetical protein
MLEVGANGRSAGLNGDRMRERDDDDHGDDHD